jgi:predicted DNA-binding antitoxin AbrB/MazE fold protein
VRESSPTTIPCEKLSGLRSEERSMPQTVQAVYENGAFRPLEPVSCHEQERVILTVARAASEEQDLLDEQMVAYCATQADEAVALEVVRQVLAKIPGSLTDDIRAERDEG